MTTKSPLLSRPGAVEAGGADAGVASHYGEPLREQRALAAGTAVVDLSSRGVVTVTGPDRLSWLNTLSSQQVTDLAPGQSTELLLLSVQGRIEFDAQGGGRRRNHLADRRRPPRRPRWRSGSTG